jgi:tRNA(adenine34) deaminase
MNAAEIVAMRILRHAAALGRLQLRARRRRLRRLVKKARRDPSPLFHIHESSDERSALDDDTDRTMMGRALELAAQAAARGEVPVGAVLYCGQTVIAEAANAREASGDPTAHAEMVVLRSAGERLGTWRLNDCSLAVTLEPCPMCAGAMVNARLGRLIYGCTDPKAGACQTLYAIPSDERLNHRVQVVGGVLANRCASLLKQFFKERRTPRTTG